MGCDIMGLGICGVQGDGLDGCDRMGLGICGVQSDGCVLDVWGVTVWGCYMVMG